MRPQISEETALFLDLAVEWELDHPELFKQLDTNAKIQTLVRCWAEARENEAQMETMSGMDSSLDSFKPPWDRVMWDREGPAPTPPWKK